MHQRSLFLHMNIQFFWYHLLKGHHVSTEDITPLSKISCRYMDKSNSCLSTLPNDQAVCPNIRTEVVRF